MQQNYKVKSNEREMSVKLSDDDFTFICKFVYDHTGIVLNDSKREMLYRRLTRIVRERKLNSFSDYCQMLKDHGDAEKDYFINSITTNLTSFFRENHHFEYLANEELPNLIKNKQPMSNGLKRLRIWSSASSTGEEPYSIAITILENMQSVISTWDVKILATDIDSNVLATGKTGVYEYRRIENVNEGFKRKYFKRGLGANENSIRVNKELSNH
jgi:chemotaxis protein methyltransferase CheR